MDSKEVDGATEANGWWKLRILGGGGGKHPPPAWSNSPLRTGHGHTSWESRHGPALDKSGPNSPETGRETQKGQKSQGSPPIKASALRDPWLQLPLYQQHRERLEEFPCPAAQQPAENSGDVEQLHFNMSISPPKAQYRFRTIYLGTLCLRINNTLN